MKSREPRQTVIMPAQMRGDSAWSEVCIRNISSHGMMLEMSRPPAPGCYVELRRSNVVVVARVMWSEEGKCGLRTQAKVDLGALSGLASEAEQTPARASSTKRRAEAVGATAEQAANTGRAMQFAFGAAFGAGIAVLLSLTAYDAMSRPFNAVRAALR